MIKLFWMTVAFGAAAYGVFLWTTADPTLSYILRDGLFFAGLGFLLALWTSGERRHAPRQASSVHASVAPSVHKTLTATGHLFFWTGAVCVLAALLLQLLLLGDSTVALTYGFIYDRLQPTAASPVVTLTTASPVVTLTTALLWHLGRLLLLIAMVFPRFWVSRRYGLAGTTAATQATATNWISLLLFVGVGTHLLVYSQLPAICTGRLCELALAVSEGLRVEQAGNLLPLWLARLFYLFTGESLLSMRLATSVLSLGALLFCYLLARQLVGNGSALLGALLVAFTPWYHTLDGTTLAALLFFFWATLGLWILLQGWQRQQPQWVLLGGLALGLASSTPYIQLALFGWLSLWMLVALLPMRPDAETTPLFSTPGILVAGGALIGFLLGAVPQFLQQAGLSALQMATVTLVPFDGISWLATLFQHGQLTAAQWTGVPPLTLLLGTTTIVGLGTVLGSAFTARNGRLWGWLLSGLLIALLLFVYMGDGPYLAESATVLFLFCVIITFFALEQWLTPATEAWRTLTSPSTLAAAMTLLLLLLSIGPLWQLLSAGQSVRSSTQAAAEQAMLADIAALWTETPDAQIFAPASVRENPAARLYLGDAQLVQLQPLHALLNAFYTTDEIRPTTYVVPNDAQPYLDLIQRLHPGIAPLPVRGVEEGETPYTVLHVSRESQLARQGLLGVAWESSTDGSSTSQLLPPLGPLQLEPSTVPEWQPPFTLQWTGALRVAIPGTYRISLEQADWLPSTQENAGAVLPPPTLSLQLDNRLILDTLLGVEQQELFLAKGFYQLTLLYRQPADPEAGDGASVPPQAFTIGWQRPDGQAELIPHNVLYNLSLPNVGLLGEYIREGEGADTPVDIRKDLVVGLVAARAEQPYRVQWRGQLAAIRPGEYLFAGLSAPDSATQLFIDGVLLFDTTVIDESESTAATASPSPSPQSDDTNAYAEGSIYLERGWHEIRVDYLPAAATDGGSAPLQLFWQPPGSSPTLLASEYLAPSLTPLTEADQALPLGPALLPEAVGNAATPDVNANAFALSYGTEYWQPQTVHPPVGLPALPVEMQWQVGSCGSEPTQLNQPHGVALSPLRRLLYVADSANQRVVEYRWDGEVNQVYTHADWREPVDIALIDEGFPVVLDAVTQGIYNLNPVTGAVDARPVGSGFYYPRGLGVDALGNLLIADTGGARIVRLQPGGEPSYTFGGPESAFGRGQPTDIIDLNGVIWAVTAENGRLWQPERGGSLNAIVPTNTIHGPHLAALSNAAFLLSDPAERRVLYLAADGEPLAQVVQPELVQPTGIAAVIDGDMLYLAVVDTANCRLTFFRTNSWPAP